MEDFRNIKQILDFLFQYKRVTQEESKRYEEDKRKEVNTILELVKELNELIEKSDYKPPYQMNILDILNVAEPFTSQLISWVFKYKYGGNNILCYSFMERFLVPIGFNMDWFNSPRITAEADRIDVCIQEKGKYTVIIENKLKGAVFQRNQIARYIRKMREEGYSDDRIFIVILQNHYYFNQINMSVWRLPEDWKKPNQERVCADTGIGYCKCDSNKFCEMCEKCERDMKEKFEAHTLIVESQLQEWFEKDCLVLVPSYEKLLKSSIIQFSDFLKGIFNNRLNQQLIMEIEKFLREQLVNSNASSLEQWESINKKIDEVDNLQKGLRNLQLDIAKDLIAEWKKNLTSKWSKWLKYEDNESFGIQFYGVWCGCCCGKDNNNKPYWGFFCKNQSEKQKEMVKAILERTGTTEVNSEKSWISWYNTSHGDDRCEAFYQAALDLGYLGDV